MGDTGIHSITLTKEQAAMANVIASEALASLLPELGDRLAEYGYVNLQHPSGEVFATLKGLSVVDSEVWKKEEETKPNALDLVSTTVDEDKTPIPGVPLV